MTRRRWWDRATDAQRMEQINAGLALDLSMGVLATNLGVSKHALAYYVRQNLGWVYARRSRQTMGTARRAKFKDFRRAYWTGEPVDFWRIL